MMGCSSGKCVEDTEISDETSHSLGKLMETSKKSVRFHDLKRDTADCSESRPTSDMPAAKNLPEQDLKMFLLMVEHAPAILENQVKNKRIRDFGS